MTEEQFSMIRKHIPVKYTWKWEFDQTKERLDLWYSKQKRGTVKDYYTSQSKYGGQIGIHYMRRQGRTYHSLDDYGLFISGKSNGLTPLGQLLFQQSVESFVYSVLGSQASTRWPIVSQGAKSLQTQIVFKKIVRDTIIEDDQTVTIGNMRKAISDTHVILNTAITPGMILIPGDLIILREKIPGYNNILNVADDTMKFGLNENVNKEIKHDNVHSDRSVVTDTVNSNRSPDRVERDSSRSYVKRDYDTLQVRSTPVSRLTTVAVGASALSFVGAMIIKGIF